MLCLIHKQNIKKVRYGTKQNDFIVRVNQTLIKTLNNKGTGTYNKTK